MNFILSFAVFMLLLGIVVTVHELGHLVIARLNGVFCEVFSFGFGPVLMSKKDSKGTEWRFSLIPLGGYVKMMGDADASSVKEADNTNYTEDELEKGSLHRKKPWQRLLIAAGGPFANFIFATVIYINVSTFNGLPEFNNTITVASEDSVAYTSGLRTGDIIIKANGQAITKFEEIREHIIGSRGKVLNLEINRSGQTQSLSIEMFKKEGDKVVPVIVLGISPKDVIYKKLPILESITSSISMTYNMAIENIDGIIKILIGKSSPKNVGGIISIFKVSSDSAEAGILSFIMMIAMISVALGAINLMPIPVLDGGTVVISAIEWLTGKPMNKKLVESIFMVGLILVVGLMLLGTWNDISNLKVFKVVENLFK
ncbi:MAG: site-2 protease family protein [Alphaproteobacteria bacterium]|nr:site-2 protease family protein [Alphaproteobacteria bacterium]